MAFATIHILWSILLFNFFYINFLFLSRSFQKKTDYSLSLPLSLLFILSWNFTLDIDNETVMKVQKSSMSSRDMKVTKLEPFAHSNKVWRKKSFNSWIHLSPPSKVRVFLSLHMTHIRKWGIILQSNLVLSLQLLPDQLAIRSTTPHGMTQWYHDKLPIVLNN